MKVEVNDKTIEQVRMMANKMAVQDNRATQHPLYYVYDKQPVLTTSDYDYDYIERYFNNDTRGDESDLCDDCRVKFSTEEELPDANDDCGCKILFLKLEDRPVVDVGPFLTEQGAQDHIHTNRYHYNQPFVYVNSAWRNFEMQGVLLSIFEVAGIDVPLCYR